MDSIGPDGEVLSKRRGPGGELAAADKVVKVYVRAHPFASSVEVQEIQSRGTGQGCAEVGAVF